MNSKIPELWHTFEEWISVNWPQGLKQLNEGADPDNIKDLERFLNIQLPNSFIDCLKIHNGEQEYCGIFNGEQFLSVEGIKHNWELWTDLYHAGKCEEFDGIPEKGVKQFWWNPKWVPFTSTTGSDYLCIDLDPDLANGGIHGQIIRMWHDSGYRSIISTSFEDFFTKYVKDVLNGQYIVEDSYLVNMEDTDYF